MLYSELKKSIDGEQGTGLTPLSEKECELKSLIKSNSRFEETERFLNEKVPDWEERTTIKTLLSPSDVIANLYNWQVCHAGKIIEKITIIGYICQAEYKPVVGIHDDHKLRDKDCKFPLDDPRWDKHWVTKDELSEFSHPDFHVDHRLIFLAKDELAEKNDLTLYVYVPFA